MVNGLIIGYNTFKERRMFMDNQVDLICPQCQSADFEVKKEATYIYTYELDNSHSPTSARHYQPLPFLFEQRDMLSSKEYIQCKSCAGQYCYDFTNNTITGEFK